MLRSGGFRIEHIRGDLAGGLTAAIVALPLALAFGVSSGAGAAAGLYGAICVGLFAALFGGTGSQISGPTGPMTVVMASVFTQMSTLDPQAGPVLAFTVVILAGLLQIMFGLMRLGRYITLVPFPVISGFMSGIGVIIIVLQLGPLLGHPGGGSVTGVLAGLPVMLSQIQWPALWLGILTLLIVCCWPAELAQRLPASLVALVAGTLVYVSAGIEGLAVVGDIPVGLPHLILPQWRWELFLPMLQAALMLAVLGSIDSLLTSLVADSMTRVRHHSDRELVGQGIGNMMAGLFGGLPGAGATMRTVVNIRAGGRTALSGVVHGLVLLGLILGAAPVAESVPHAVLAGILIKVGVDIIDWRFLRRLPRTPFFVAALMLLVLGLTVLVDLITAVLVGIFIANVVTMKRLADNQLDSIRVINSRSGADKALSKRERTLLAASGERVVLYMFDGPVSYGAATGLLEKLPESSAYEVLLLDFSRVPLIDVSTALAVEEMIVEIQAAGRSVYIVGMNPVVQDVLQRLKVLSLVPERCCHRSRKAGLKAAYRSVSGD